MQAETFANPIFSAFLRDALLERLKIFQYYLRVLRCYHFELHSNLGFAKVSAGEMLARAVHLQECFNLLDDLAVFLLACAVNG